MKSSAAYGAANVAGWVDLPTGPSGPGSSACCAVWRPCSRGRDRTGGTECPIWGSRSPRVVLFLSVPRRRVGVRVPPPRPMIVHAALDRSRRCTSSLQRAKLPGAHTTAYAATTSACSRAGQMAGQRDARASRLLRRARQQQGDPGIPHPGNQALVPSATTPQPAHPPELDTHG